VSTAIQEEIIQKTWLKQHGDPIYIAHAVLSLADNPFITGQTLCVDGGRR
jgi:pteridine reductase